MKASLLLLFCFSIIAQGQQLNIIPEPVSVKQPRIAAKFTINPSTQIVLEGSGLENAAAFLNDYLQQCYLFKLKIVNKLSSANSIILNYERMDNEVAGAYRMTVNNKGVYIAGDNAQGVFYGIQTLIQLLPVPEARLKMRPNKLAIPYVSIEDAPRFGYRGLMLDVCRHFFPISFVKRYIDYLALHKFNTFHWHLTDDQGWRIEIKKYPKLTSVGAWRNGTIIGRYPGTGNDNLKYGGFYTQEEVKEIVKYAADRYIDVIPEIEMPGHGSAAIAAYNDLSCFPDVPTKNYFPKNQVWAGDSTGKQVQQTWGVFDDVFCAGKENTFQFLQDVLDEVIPLFRSKYVHVGGDECPKENWKKCPLCQQRMKENNLKDEHELQSYFIQRMEKYINGKGKTLIGWDEILEGGLAPKAVVMSWRGEEGGIAAAKENHDVIMTPGGWVYFDHTQSENEDSVTIGGFTPVQKVYGYEPIPAALNAEQSKYVLGAQANLWTEYIKNTKKVEYMVFPRMTALSEVLWSPKEKRNLDGFEKKLETQFKRYDLWGANSSKAFFEPKTQILPTYNNQGLNWKIIHRQGPSDILLIKKDDLEKDTMALGYYESDTIPVTIKNSGFYEVEGWTPYLNKRIPKFSTSQKFFFSKATGKKITITNQPAKNYPGDGAFTLVNGVHNEKGLARSKEILGWSGDDMEAVIDLGSNQTISSAIVHSLSSGGSWVYPPQYAEVFISQDGQNFSSVSKSEKFEMTAGSNGVIKLSFAPVAARYVKIVAKNLGIIPTGMRGAGNKAWLFVDEIEVN
jgi:hexosaminidase